MEKMRSKITVSHPHRTPFSNVVSRSWGRVLAAVGSSQGLSKPLEPTLVNVLFVPDDGSPALPVLVGGEPENVDEVRAKEILSEGKFEIKIQLGIGEESAQYWTCDFSYVSLSLFLSLLWGAFEIRGDGRHGRVIFPLPRFIFSIIVRCATLLGTNWSAFCPFSFRNT